jgi:hypothetical protein
MNEQAHRLSPQMQENVLMTSHEWMGNLQTGRAAAKATETSWTSLNLGWVKEKFIRTSASCFSVVF